MSENPSGHNGSNPQNSPYGNNYDPSGSSSGSYGQGNYGQGNYGQGDYGSQYSQADFGSSYGQDAQQPVGSQGGYADYQQDPQAYGGSDLYGAGGPGGPGGPSSTEKNSLGVISLVSGIVGFFIWLVGIVAIITGFMSLKAVKNGQANNKGVGLTGLILGFFTTVVGLIVTVIVVAMFVIGAGVAGGSPTGGEPADGAEAPADPGEDDGDEGEAEGGEAAEGDDFYAGADKAKLIGTYESIEIRAYVTHGETDEIALPEEFRERDVLVIKYFLKNTSDQTAQLGYTDVKCVAGGKDCSENVAGRIGDKWLDGGASALGAHDIGAGEEEEFVTAQSVEYKDAGDAEISLLVSDRDFKDEKEFKIK